MIKPIEKKENKTRRVETTLRPSTHEKLKKYTEKTGYSVNGLINAILEEFLESAENNRKN